MLRNCNKETRVRIPAAAPPTSHTHEEGLTRTIRAADPQTLVGNFPLYPQILNSTKFVFMDISRISNDRIIEEWAEFDMGASFNISDRRRHYMELLTSNSLLAFDPISTVRAEHFSST
jgi:hypothetical protein